MGRAILERNKAKKNFRKTKTSYKITVKHLREGPGI